MPIELSPAGLVPSTTTAAPLPVQTMFWAGEPMAWNGEAMEWT